MNNVPVIYCIDNKTANILGNANYPCFHKINAKLSHQFMLLIIFILSIKKWFHPLFLRLETRLFIGLDTIMNRMKGSYQIRCLTTLQLTWFTNHINWIFLFLAFMHQSVVYDSSIERFRTNVSHRSPRRYYVQLRKQDKYRKSSKRIPYKHDKLTKSASSRIISIKS